MKTDDITWMFNHDENRVELHIPFTNDFDKPKHWEVQMFIREAKAAPELLEVAQRTIAYFEWLDGADVDEPDYRQGELMEEFYEAIKKATA